MGISAETRTRIREIARQLDVARERLETVNAAVVAESTESELAAWNNAEELIMQGIAALEDLGLEQVGD